MCVRSVIGSSGMAGPQEDTSYRRGSDVVRATRFEASRTSLPMILSCSNIEYDVLRHPLIHNRLPALI